MTVVYQMIGSKSKILNSFLNSSEYDFIKKSSYSDFYYDDTRSNNLGAKYQYRGKNYSAINLPPPVNL